MEKRVLKPIPVVEFVTLRAGATPPQDGSFVHVAPSERGGFEVTGCALGERATKFFMAPTSTPFDDALNSAKLWAERHGVPTVYISR